MEELVENWVGPYRVAQRSAKLQGHKVNGTQDFQLSVTQSTQKRRPLGPPALGFPSVKKCSLISILRGINRVIIGGTESKPHSHPYMAYLEIVTLQGKQKACGGFLIRRDFVLTAVHCAGSSISVTLGAHNIVDRERTQQVIQVRRAIPHPHYNDKTLSNDIMLLQLTRKAEMSDAVSPINLPRSLEKLKEKANLTLAVGTLPLPPHVTFIRPGRMCQVAGWGRTGVKEPASSTLQEVKLRLMEPRACRHFRAFDHNLQLCVGNPQSTKSAFKGDSGGPLLCAGVAQGIVSYGLSSAKPPAVFTRISPYRPWIDEVLKEN
ncbi:hypothetical protein MJT46_012474 [Ovis ammon polii x Ovis aries]|nr:hypothetical protein MJT46_012474 [Ovis ammon polii x Ovis aries]